MCMLSSFGYTHLQIDIISSFVKLSGKENEFDTCSLLPIYKPGWALSTLEGRII